MAITQGEIDEIVVRVTADVAGYVNSLQKAEQTTRTWSTALGVVLGNFATQLFARATAGVKQFLSESVALASRAQESLSAFEAVFGDQAAIAAHRAEELGNAIGRSSRRIKADITSQQAFFLGLGFAADEATKLSFQVQKLALDLASFRNITDEEAVNRFRAALSGSTEVMDQFGINIKVSALEQEALEQGIEKSVAKMTEQEKVMLRISLIAKQMGIAVGDAERTAGSFANAGKNVADQWEDAKTKLGKEFLPALQAAMPAISLAAHGVKELADSIGFLTKALTGNLHVLNNIARSDPRIGGMFLDAMRDVDFDVENLGISRLQALEIQEGLLTELLAIQPNDVQKQIIGGARRLIIAEIEKLRSPVEEVAEKVGSTFGTKFVQGIRDSVRGLNLGDALRPIFGRGGFSGDFGLFGAIGGGLNSFNKAIEELRQSPQTKTIRQTGGRAVFAGTSEAVSLTQISQRTISENDRRDKLLKGANDFLKQLVDNGKQVLSTLKENGITVEGVDIP